MFKIIDYKFGNIYSISNMLNELGLKSCIINSPDEIKDNDRIILPGVGSYDNAIISLKKLGFYDLFKYQIFNKNLKLIGICLGMQLMCEGSTEGKKEGLGLIKGLCKKFSNRTFIGWSRTSINNNFINKKILKNFNDEERYYFLHSYYLPVNDNYSFLNCSNNNIKFTAALNYKNIYGFQFHPERSHKFGMKIFKNLNTILDDTI
jgi:glutamine amidotransferase